MSPCSTRIEHKFGGAKHGTRFSANMAATSGAKTPRVQGCWQECGEPGVKAGDTGAEAWKREPTLSKAAAIPEVRLLPGYAGSQRRLARSTD